MPLQLPSKWNIVWCGQIFRYLIMKNNMDSGTDLKTSVSIHYWIFHFRMCILICFKNWNDMHCRVTLIVSNIQQRHFHWQREIWTEQKVLRFGFYCDHILYFFRSILYLLNNLCLYHNILVQVPHDTIQFDHKNNQIVKCSAFLILLNGCSTSLSVRFDCFFPFSLELFVLSRHSALDLNICICGGN